MAIICKEIALILVFVAVSLRAVSSQGDLCPTLWEAASNPNISCTFNNCTSLTCTLPALPGGGDASQESLTFQVEACMDPVRMVVVVQGVVQGTEPLRLVLDRTGDVHLGGRTLTIGMSRNATYLDLQVSVFVDNNTSPVPAEYPVLPRLLIPLNPNICMCHSVTALAMNTGHTFLAPQCYPNHACDGVICELFVGGLYYIETLILPCVDSLELVVRESNRNGNVIFTTIFNETGVRPLVISSSLTVNVDAVIVSGMYSMNVSATVEDFLFGPVEIFPLHTVILDRTHCDLPHFTTLPPPPPAVPLPAPPPDSSPICLSFYAAIRELYTEPFICGHLRGNCGAGINCTLFILDKTYSVTVAYVDAMQNFIVQVFDQNGESLEVADRDEVAVSLPSPRSLIIVNQRKIANGIRGIQINLTLYLLNGATLMDNLLRHSRVLLSTEQCQALLQATFDPATRCAANGDCSGLSCDLDMTSVREDDVAFVVDKCRDPVVVSITTFHGGVATTNLDRTDSIFLGGGEYLAVVLSRNATDLDFMAYISNTSQFGELVRPVVPQVYVPLNASECMCDSMRQLAALAGHNVIETGCSAHADCNGIRCELDVFGNIFYVDMTLSACDEIVYIRVLNSSLGTLLSTELRESVVTQFEIVPGFPLTVSVVLEPRDYSLVLEASLDEPFFGYVNIIPRHIIILDRTSCNHQNFVTIPRPPPATPPPSPGTSVSETCTAFYRIISSHFMEPFVCRARTPCESGFRCQLEILDTTYDVVISLSSDSVSLELQVVDSQGRNVTDRSADSKGVTNVTLPRPQNSNLSLTQNFDGERDTISLQLDLYVFALDGQPRRDVLIANTEIPLETSKVSKSTVAIATAASILILAVIVVAVIILAVFLVRKRKATEGFDFHPMSHSELQEKDLEHYLHTDKGSLPSTRAGVGVASHENGTEEKEDLSEPQLDLDNDNGHLV